MKLLYEIIPLGDSAISIQFGNEISKEANEQVHLAARKLKAAPFPGMIDIVPAFHTLTLHYNPTAINSADPFQKVCNEVANRLHAEVTNYSTHVPERLIKIPVCYEEEFAPDLAEVAKTNQLTKDEVIAIHSSKTYNVYFIGFAPGFPFLGGMDKRISTPRKNTPRTGIPAGSVGIAGSQTGIYPIDTPGGWQLIGRSPLPLFLPQAEVPSLLRAGDLVKFVPISRQSFENWEESAWASK
ncbi:hypothetical protein CVD25_08115 [Bacillus canaveralius]|uniref:Carboxyltransferase domain-containing protein n=1 Tax=Bacillus canaveralius TaxID=1403243 RepID=A0A2N5GIH5_9BACI|nr:5-oxoprolinase subunit PxpB [Bacillus canaveralius]PLR80797.1 hypothetical protein CU635_17255 [Bacillus canaveralius]PLR98325.1 hypothetical protein CVD25_08115 [Bacillus canaveralius]